MTSHDSGVNKVDWKRLMSGEVMEPELGPGPGPGPHDPTSPLTFLWHVIDKRLIQNLLTANMKTFVKKQFGFELIFQSKRSELKHMMLKCKHFILKCHVCFYLTYFYFWKTLFRSKSVQIKKDNKILFSVLLVVHVVVYGQTFLFRHFNKVEIFSLYKEPEVQPVTSVSRIKTFWVWTGRRLTWTHLDSPDETVTDPLLLFVVWNDVCTVCFSDICIFLREKKRSDLHRNTNVNKVWIWTRDLVFLDQNNFTWKILLQTAPEHIVWK